MDFTIGLPLKKKRRRRRRRRRIITTWCGDYRLFDQVHTFLNCEDYLYYISIS
jgi:hypothetical protein